MITVTGFRPLNATEQPLIECPHKCGAYINPHALAPDIATFQPFDCADDDMQCDDESCYEVETYDISLRCTQCSGIVLALALIVQQCGLTEVWRSEYNLYTAETYPLEFEINIT